MSTYFVLLLLFYDASYFVVMDRYVNDYPGNKEFRVLNVLNEILHRDHYARLYGEFIYRIVINRILWRRKTDSWMKKRKNERERKREREVDGMVEEDLVGQYSPLESLLLFDSLTNTTPWNIYHSSSTRARSLHSCWMCTEFHVESPRSFYVPS